jgi:hypothetical protein
LQKFLENSAFVWQGCGHGAAGGVFCDATNQELQKLLRQTSLPASHQYGLQVAEGLLLPCRRLKYGAMRTDAETAMLTLKCYSCLRDLANVHGFSDRKHCLSPPGPLAFFFATFAVLRFTNFIPSAAPPLAVGLNTRPRILL